MGSLHSLFFSTWVEYIENSTELKLKVESRVLVFHTKQIEIGIEELKYAIEG